MQTGKTGLFPAMDTWLVLATCPWRVAGLSPRSRPLPSYLANEKGVWSRDWNFTIVNTLVTNNLGFVTPQDYVKTDKTVVAVIGDSFVEAAMTSYDRTFYGRLAAKLRPENTLVYTFAMSGAQLPDYLAWARYAVSQFAPQYMVFVIIPNDYDESLAKNKLARARTIFTRTRTNRFPWARWTLPSHL